MDKSIDNLLVALKERAKELNCLYAVEELFNQPDISIEGILQGIVLALPAGWQYPDVCQAKITYGDQAFQTPNLVESPWAQSVDIKNQDEIVGRITVYYIAERPAEDEGPFLKEERRLINTISDRLERRIFYEKLKGVFENQRSHPNQLGQSWVIIDLLKKTDTKLLMRISRKMLNYLSWSGMAEANKLLELFSPASVQEEENSPQDMNRPLQKKIAKDFLSMTGEIFTMANTFLGEQEVLNSIQKWIVEDRSNFLMKVLEDPASSLAEITNAIERFHHLAPHGLDLPLPREKAFRVSLIRRLLNGELHFINIAKDFIPIDDFYDLLHHIIFPAGSYGRLGGKGAGLSLASKILQSAVGEHEFLKDIKTPKTWYLTSDGILKFINHNDLEELLEQKYEDIALVRQEYPYIVHLFKNSSLPPEIVNGLSVALDDFGETPLIVRSSSLLEDRMGTAFAGKYKSLFIANQGTKRERLLALMDAITEVYASTFSPDPIEYRLEHGMIDFNEEMGILIQEVVGKKVGHYYMPAFAGVAFSNNEFRWSPRIRREDGLIRLVPGLGTRAVDRLSDDYPLLIAPGQPNLRANVTIEEKVHYSPKMIDVINLKTNSFETIEIRELLKQFGDEYPLIDQLVSILKDDRLEQSGGLGIDFEKDFTLFTFEEFINKTRFVEQVHAILKVLQQKLNTPIDIEFAHDGKNLYLLQCRPQSYSVQSKPAVIPADIPRENILFSAKRDVTNGTVSDITHIVYIDPNSYSELTNRSDLLAIGKAVSKLNQMLPKRQFILMGPGRWGSRGDIKLGVNVTYSDINNTAMLVEIARKRRDYMPELSFGTHFFQDLVEASIRYLPLYPDTPDVIFNESFFTQSKNMLPDLLPEFSSFAETIRVIELAEAANGRMLQVLMNGERDEAIAMFVEASPVKKLEPTPRVEEEIRERKDESHWKWRQICAERLASQLDPDRFGVKAMYLFGSTKNATAGPKSDIDIIVHFHGTKAQRKDLVTWFDGWSASLSEMNYLRTGFETEGLLDVHIVTDEDIEKRTSFAVKIGAVTDAPRPLLLKRKAR